MEEDVASINADDVNRSAVADVEPAVSVAGSESVMSPTVGDAVKTETDNVQVTPDGGQASDGLVTSTDSNKAKPRARSRKPPPLGEKMAIVAV